MGALKDLYMVRSPLEYVVIYHPEPLKDAEGWWPRRWIHDFSKLDVEALDLAAELAPNRPRLFHLIPWAPSRWVFKRRTKDLIVLSRDGRYVQGFCRWFLEDVDQDTLPVGATLGVVFAPVEVGSMLG